MTESTLAESSIDMTAFSDAFDYAAMCVETFDSADAFALAQDYTDQIIAALQRDSRWASLRYAELDLLLADVRKQFAHNMTAKFDGFVPLDQLQELANEAFAESAAQTGSAP